MKKITFFFVILFVFFSCNKRYVQLPQVSGTNLLKEIQDYSMVYIFFDEATQTAELNKNNLITSTHWVFNVDKRLSLAQAGAKIVALQKKKDAPNIHKNPNSRNFFSVADMTEKKLRFLEFTKTQFSFVSEGNQLPENVLNTDELKHFSNQVKNDKNSIPKIISVEGSVSFQDFILFLQKIQEEGVFFEKIIIN
ncbi:MAG: hypothetical protein Q4C98_07870 [Capnocytophaga sp.]|nr:hypothetical protein [Capnocytophaga sp.]